MAKKKALTLEERLQEALVPKDEQPYEIPDNWCWTRLGDLSLLISKGTTPKGGKDAYIDYGVNFLRVENLNDDGSISHEGIKHIKEDVHLNYLKRSILKENDILVSIAGTLGKTGIVHEIDIPMNTNQAIAFIRLKDKRLDSYFIKYSIDNPVTQTLLKEKTKVTSIPNLTLEIISKCLVPLPPLAEQQRIVDKIESMFAKLEEARENAQEVLDSFETRKAAILHKAFTGELTREYNNGYRLECHKIGELAKTQYGYTESATDEVVGPKFLRITDIQNGVVNWPLVPYCKINSENYKKYMLKKGDIVVARTGATTGKSYLIKDNVDAVFASYLIQIKIDSSDLIPQYLYKFMQSPEYWEQITDFSSGIAQPGVNAKKLKEIQFPLPDIDEQKEIVRILDDLLEKEEQAKEAAQQVLEQIEIIKKSILARAFRGELGTNDPSEESSIELLKEIVSRDD